MFRFLRLKVPSDCFQFTLVFSYLFVLFSKLEGYILIQDQINALADFLGKGHDNSS